MINFCKRVSDRIIHLFSVTSPSEIGSSSQSLRSLTPTHSSYPRERYNPEENSPPAEGSPSGAFHSPNDSSYDLPFDDQRRLPPPYKRSRQHQQPQDDQQVVQRSSWQTMLLEAGGFSIAWSEESMRKLKYVLQWLQVNIAFNLLLVSSFPFCKIIYCFFSFFLSSGIDDFHL